MKILVTGGSGFIGARLVELLQTAGHSVAIYDKAANAKSPSGAIQADIRDAARLAQAAEGAEAIVHLAAEHRDNVAPLSLYDEVNVGGAENIAAAAARAGCRRVIFTSSVAVYALNVPNPTEETEARPFNPYGESKFKAEQVLLRWARETAGSTLVIVRPCVVFGEGNRGNVYNLFAQIHRKRFVMVGDGRNKKSMAYVGNVARFLLECLNHPPGNHLYNYADKPDLSVSELVDLANRTLGRTAGGLYLPRWAGMAAGHAFDLAAQLSGRTFPLSAIRIKKFCADTTVSTQRLEKTAFQRPFPLEEGLRRTLLHEFGAPGETVQK